MNKYFSVDLELAGNNSDMHSIISLGACTINGDSEFYREMKPISFEYQRRSMMAASMGLKCLTEKMKRNPHYDPTNVREFRPEFILKLLYKCGSDPKQAIIDFDNWVKEQARGENAIMIAKPIGVDVPFMEKYCIKFIGYKGPFGEYEDLDNAYRRITQNHGGSVKHLGLMDVRQCDHNSLEDALFQAKQFTEVMKLKEALT